jgi:hypothetical protein
MDVIRRQVSDCFAEFEKGGDPMIAFKALEIMESAERERLPDDQAACRLAVARRLHFFELLEPRLDPGWDPEQHPPMGVTPPEDAPMVRGSGEVDPATIADPQRRAAYVAALKANKAARRRYFVQLELHRADERALRRLPPLLDCGFGRTPDGARDLEALLADFHLSKARQQRLRALLGARPAASGPVQKD